MPIINQITVGGGTTPTGTIQITTNGTHDVTNYATADVNVPTTAPALYREFQLDANGVLQPNTTTTHIMDFTGMTDVSTYLLYYAYYRNTAISGTVDMSDLIKVTGSSACAFAFAGCTGITGVNLSSFESITGSAVGACQEMFTGCTGLTTINLGNFRSVLSTSSANSMFINCTNLSSVDVSKLGAITGNTGCASMFSGCNLTTIAFDSLSQITGKNAMKEMLASNSSLQSLWFYALTPSSFGNRTDQFNNMLLNDTNVTVHFPMAIQSTIGSWSDVTAGFGGTNTTVLFDLVTSLTGADGNTYTRQEKDSTATATAWVYNNTLYYTSGVSDNTNGVNEPSVSDAIYSDAACTQSVTTITAVA